MSNKLTKSREHGHYAHLRLNKDGELELYCEQDKVGYLMPELYAAQVTGETRKLPPSELRAWMWVSLADMGAIKVSDVPSEQVACLPGTVEHVIRVHRAYMRGRGDARCPAFLA